MNRLPPGEVFVSTAGKLPCKKVIHAVGPRWINGRHNEENDLYDAVYMSLSAASDCKFNSIALPPISAGIFNYPLDQCVEVIAEATNKFVEETPGTSLRAIYLVSVNVNEVEAISNALKTFHGNKAQIVDRKKSDKFGGGDLYKSKSKDNTHIT